MSDSATNMIDKKDSADGCSSNADLSEKYSKEDYSIRAETLGDAHVEKEIFVAGQWLLFWWKFKKHRLAVVSLITMLMFYIVAAIAEFAAPMNPDQVHSRFIYAPPQTIQLWRKDESGTRFYPHVLGYKIGVDPSTGIRGYLPDPNNPIQVGFWTPLSEPVMLMGLIPIEHRLFGPVDPSKPVYLLGADRLGRDILSRVIFGARVSLSVGLVGVAISLFLGILLGGISGYFGGSVDMIIQRLIEFVRSVPTIPLWMGMAAAIPLAWPPLRTYFVITLIVSLVGWTSLAREVRGRFLSLRHEEFVAAARLDGMSEFGIIFKHLLPSFYSHIIAVLTLSIPAMILAETSLSFLGIGLRSPVISWGVLLQEAQNVLTVSRAPWLLLVPGGCVMISVLSLNFLGDGLRDAADPYSR